MVEATSATTGMGFFEALVLNLTKALGVRHSIVGELTGPGQSHSHTLGVAWNGVKGENFTYAVEGTPCEQVLARGKIAYFPSGVAELFPRDEGLARMGIRAYLGTPLHASDGGYLGLLVVMHDQPLDEATEPASILRIFAVRAAHELERMRAANQLARREEQLRYALASASMACFEWDPATGGTLWSEGAEALLGRSLAEIDGTEASLGDAVLAADGAQFRAVARELREGLRDEFDMRYRIEQSDGAVRWIDHRGRATRGADGRRRVSGVLADVTAHETMQRELVKSQKLEAVGRIASGVVHDFNNLLGAVELSADLAEETLGSEEARELMAPIHDAVARASRLTTQLLGFSKRLPAEPRVVDPNASIKEMGPLLARVLGARIELQLELDPRAGVVLIDPTNLERLLLNLAINARDAMPDGGRLTITTRRCSKHAPGCECEICGPNGCLQLAVADTGVGMDEQTRARVFEPFFTTKGEKGTGLGLATCHRIVSEAKGLICLASTPGAGTQVSVLLPLCAPEPRQMPPAGAS